LKIFQEEDWSYEAGSTVINFVTYLTTLLLSEAIRVRGTFERSVRVFSEPLTGNDMGALNIL
jgi:hypothetical protein